jgi:hypothetical protein
MLLFITIPKRKKYINRVDSGLFDKSDRLHQVQSMGDTLNQIRAIMDWEIFTPVLDLRKCLKLFKIALVIAL